MHVVPGLQVLYFGTPVALLSTTMPDGSTNLTPMSSAWALGDCYVLGLGFGGQGVANLMRTGEVVVNLPDVDAAERPETVYWVDPIHRHP